MIFPDMYAACAAVKPFVDHGAAAVELVDRARCVRSRASPGARPLENFAGKSDRIACRVPRVKRGRLVARPSARECYLGRPYVARTRGIHTGPVLAAHFERAAGCLHRLAALSLRFFVYSEDVCFPPERLADGAPDLQALFAKHGYTGIVRTRLGRQLALPHHTFLTIRRRSLITAHSR